MFAFCSFVSSNQEELRLALQAMTVGGANHAVKKVSVGRPALSVPMIINVVMANNVAMASACRGALLLVLVPLLILGGIKMINA